MNAAQLERLGEHMTRLRLFKSRERIEALLQEDAAKEIAYSDFLDQVLSEEVAAKTTKNVAMRTALARFPFVKPLETFDFAYQPSIDKKQLAEVATCRFLEHGDNVILLGPPGVGKTHLAVALGLKAIERGPMILTSNQSFAAWGEVFGDRVIATAILDRLLHHAVTVNIRGNSYRLKEKLKAGLVRTEETES
jgi:DNA replication protein DnaC